MNPPSRIHRKCLIWGTPIQCLGEPISFALESAHRYIHHGDDRQYHVRPFPLYRVEEFYPDLDAPLL